MAAFELQRADSICTPPEIQLLEYVKANHIPKIKSFVTENPKSLHTIIGHPYDKPILHIACYELADSIRSDTVETLIDLGSDLYYTDDVHNHMEALHFATLGGNPNVLKTILAKIKPDKINSLTSNENTAINLLIKEGNVMSEHFPECVRILIQAGIDVNKSDGKNLTPIFWAAKKGYTDIVRLILYESGQSVDVDNHKLRGKSARDYMMDLNLSDAFTTPNNNEIGSVNNALFDLLKEYDEDAFIRNKHAANSADAEDGIQTLLQLATKTGLTNAVAFLLNNGADPNKTTQKTPSAPIEIAASEGYHKIFKVLLQRDDVAVPGAILTELLKHSDDAVVTDEINHNQCYELLLKCKIRNVDINCKNKSGSTALHYAARYGGAIKTLDLLRNGASMACKNKYGAMPIEDIDCNTLETHLNECMETNVDSNIDKENFTATFNYKTLMPPNPYVSVDKTGAYDAEAACQLITSEIQQLSSETQVVSYMSKSPELKHLLMHPTITSFLYMKWHRIRWFFYTNLAFYVTFCFSLILYIFLIYGNHSDDQHATLAQVLSSLLGITFVLLILRELFQIAVSPKTYFRNLENWLELLLLTLTAVILIERSPLEQVRKQVAAVTILLAAFEMVLLIGQHPKMSTNIVMLRTVSTNFFKFLLWYSILIIAFALSFYILLKDNQEVKAEENEADFFVSPGLSLFKTIVMLTGEFDAGSINFDVYPITSHIIFMLFVFMIAIILFNLLNGLAVSDTQLIKSNAELVGHIARIEHIAYIESMLLGNVLPSSVVNCFQKYCCCLPFDITQRLIIPGILLKRVCLFPYFLRDFKLAVYPNQYARVGLPDEVYSDSDSGTSCTNCANIYLDRQTAKRMKRLIREKKQDLEMERLKNSSVKKQNDLIERQQKYIDELKKDQAIILNKLDYIISNACIMSK